jgi:elongation factor G
MDRIGSDFGKAVASIREKLGAKAVPIQIPIGAESEFLGVVDLVIMKAILYKDETKGAKFEVADIPAELQDEAKAAREYLIESISEVDETLMEKYIGGEALSEAEVKAGIRKGALKMELFPVLCGSAFKSNGPRCSDVGTRI